MNTKILRSYSANALKLLRVYRSVIVSWLLVLWMTSWILALTGCSPAGIQIGPNELAKISEGATVVGVATVKLGLEPVAQVLENKTGSQVLFWPGAKTAADQLWNMVCLVKCTAGWEESVTRYWVGQGYTMTADRASRFTQALIDSGYWTKVSMAPPIMNAAAAAAISVGTNWYTISAAGIMIMPDNQEGPQL